MYLDTVFTEKALAIITGDRIIDYAFAELTFELFYASPVLRKGICYAQLANWYFWFC